MIDTDVIIALVMLGIVLIVFFIVRIRLLPRKTLPFIVGALAGVIGISLFKRMQTKGLLKELEKREKALQEKEKRLNDLKNDYQTSEKQLELAKAELQKQREAYEKMLLQLKAKNKEEKERIDKLSGEALHNEFLTAFES